MFFRTSIQSLEKRQSMMPLFEFLEHAPEKFLACFMRVRANDVIWWTVEDSGRESHVK